MKKNKYSEKKEYFWKRKKQFEEITFKREDFIHSVTGKIVKVRKTSIRLLVNNEKNIDIGFRNIL